VKEGRSYANITAQRGIGQGTVYRLARASTLKAEGATQTQLDALANSFRKKAPKGNRTLQRSDGLVFTDPPSAKAEQP